MRTSAKPPRNEVTLPRPQSGDPSRVPPPNERRALTRVDVLVCVAVVGMILFVQTPARGHAAWKTRELGCRQNLARLNTAWFLFATDSGDVLPGNLFVPRTADSNRTWCVGTLSAKSLTVPDNTNVWLLRNSQLGLYMGDEVASYRCPSRALGNARKYLEPLVRTYSMNNYVGPGGYVETKDFKRFDKLGDFDNPGWDRIFVFMDEHAGSVNDGSFLGDMRGSTNPSGTRFLDWPTAVHHAGANLSFADGHTEYWRWRDPRVLAYKFNPWSDPPYSLPDSPDVLRLLEHTSVPLAP